MNLTDRQKTVLNSLPSDLFVLSVVADDDPFVMDCLPPGHILACFRGDASDGQVSEAEKWLESRPAIQRRAKILLDRLFSDLALLKEGTLPQWAGTPWSVIIRCEWSAKLDEAVEAGEQFYATHPPQAAVF